MGKALAENRRARHDYRFLETYEAGVELLGHEVKAAKAGHVSLKGAHAAITTNPRTGKPEAWLLNMHIGAYKPAGPLPDYEPTRSRRLLLSRQELRLLLGRRQQKGLTIIPVSLYLKNRLVKVQIALAQGKTQFDKRQDIKARESKRDIRRVMKRG